MENIIDPLLVERAITVQLPEVNGPFSSRCADFGYIVLELILFHSDVLAPVQFLLIEELSYICQDVSGGRFAEAPHAIGGVISDCRDVVLVYIGEFFPVGICTSCLNATLPNAVLQRAVRD